MLKPDRYKRIMARIESYRQQMIDLQVALTAIPALAPENGGDGEYDKARFLLEFLAAGGFEDVLVVNAPDERVSSGVRPSIIVRIPGARTRTVWIVTHTDVVPPGELSLWTHDPYGAIVRDGRIYGRGTEDNQQDLVASLFAAKAFIDEKIEPESTVGLAFVADEETSSALGMHHILQRQESVFHPHDYIVVSDFGNPDGSLIEIAEKSILWIKFKTTGIQCHASTPDEGKNAFAAASQFVVSLRRLYRTFNRRDSFFHPATSTFEPTKKESNVPNINTIPGEDIFYLDCRVLPAYDVSVVLTEIRSIADGIEKKFGVTIEIAPVQHFQAPLPTSKDAPVVRALSEAVRNVYGISAAPAGIGGGTVASPLRHRGYEAAVWSRLNETAHRPDENCLIDNMLGNAKVYAHLFLHEA